MSYWWFGTLPRVPIEQLFNDKATSDYTIINAGWRLPGTSITLHELNCIVLALRATSAERVLEIGTYDGNTSLNLAANVPETGVVVTVDLPLDESNPEYALEIGDASQRNVTDRTIVGQQFRDHQLNSRIRQVLADTGALDFETLGTSFDMAFIDGCHAYEYVKSDTENALKVVRAGGLILWHDYAILETVSKAVDEYANDSRFLQLNAIESTRLAVGFVR